MMAPAKSELNAAYWLGVLTPVIVPLIVMILVAPMALVRAYVFTWLWHWYLEPLFALPPLRLVFAYGILLITSFAAARQFTSKRKDDDHTLWKSAVITVASSGFVLFFGWIGTFFI